MKQTQKCAVKPRKPVNIKTVALKRKEESIALCCKIAQTTRLCLVFLARKFVSNTGEWRASVSLVLVSLGTRELHNLKP